MIGLRKLPRLEPRDRRAVVTAGVLTATIRTLLAVLPLRTVLRLVERLAGPPADPPRRADAAVRRLTWAVEAAGLRFLRRNRCLTQALVGLVLFRRSGLDVTLRIGVARREPATHLTAHAWLESDGTVLVGGEESPSRYVPFPRLEPGAAD